MRCDFKINKLSDEYAELKFCQGECARCKRLQEEFDLFINQRQKDCMLNFPTERVITIGISPLPDFLSYWKSPEGLVQIIEGLFRGDIRKLESVEVFLSFEFKEVKGFSIPMFCLELQLFGDSNSLNLIDSELTEWSPRICGWLSETSKSVEIELLGTDVSDYSVFQDFLLEYEYDYLNGLTLLSPIQLNWEEFVGIRDTGVLNRVSI